jgi:hypothetical protein
VWEIGGRGGTYLGDIAVSKVMKLIGKCNNILKVFVNRLIRYMMK